MLSIFTLAIYLLGSLGTSFNIHLCEGKLVNIALVNSENTSDYDCCETHNKKIESSCCDEKVDGIQEEEEDCTNCSNIQLSPKSDKTQIISIQSYSPEWIAIIPNKQTFWIEDSDILFSFVFTTHQYAQPPPGLWQDRPLFSLYQNRKLDC